MITLFRNILTVMFLFMAIAPLSAQESMESGFVFYHEEDAAESNTAIRRPVSKNAMFADAATNKEEAIVYADREHAFYRAPVRTCVIYTQFKADAGKNDYYIVIEKSKYLLHVYNADDQLLATYPIVLGKDDIADKMYEGDRGTPEGTFKIINKRSHSEWDKFLALDYPNKESYEKFKERKEKGLVPKDAGIGGSIGLHGTRAKEDITIDRRENWTYGCISTKNTYIDELYNYIPLGTKVIIRK